MTHYKEEFTAYISACVNNGCTVSLRTALEKIKSIIVKESPRLTNLEGLKNSWKSRLYHIYKQMLKKNETPPIDLEVSDDIWINLYMEISKYEIDNCNKLSKADRQRVVARLYRDENGKLGHNLLSESSSEIVELQEKNNELPQKRKLISDEDEVSEAENDESVEYDSFLTDETEKTDLTYKTEPSTGYAENFKSREYVLTLYELKKYEEELIGYTYDEDSTLDERLSISSIEFNTVLSPKCKLVPAVLNDEEYTQLRVWRRCIANDEVYFPPHATTIDQLNLNNLLCHVADTVLKNDIDKSEIGFIADNISSIFRYLFPLKDLISYKWDKSSFKINNNVSQKLRLDLVFYANDQEIGCGEVKVCNHNSSLLDNDRARIAETLKRQLHVRIMKCKSPEQMATFGMFCNDHDIELYIMSFDEKAEQPYQLNKVRTLTVPGSLHTYTNMDETLEYLKSFKKTMVSSLLNEEDLTKPFIYHEYSPFFKPTLSFKKE